MRLRRGEPNRPVPPVRLIGEAVALHQGDRLDEAAQRYRAILSADPRHFDSLHLLGVLRAQQGNFAEAVTLLRRAIDCNPVSAAAHNNLGMTLNLSGRHEDAIIPLEKAIALSPGDATAYNNLGIALQALGRHQATAASFQRAVALKPDYVEALSNLGGILQALGRSQEAIPLLERALALNPRFAEARLNLGSVLRVLDRREEAMTCFDRVLALDPRNALAYDQLGAMHAEAGRFADARRCYERALEIQPRNARILFSLVQCGKITANDPVLAALESLAENSAALSDDQRIQLQFALGKVYAELGQEERSFGQYLEGNARKRRQTVYDEEQDVGLFDRIRQVFSAELMRSKTGVGNPSDRPIFVLGMMRSGSTLVEQILASHPKVLAAGERPDFNEAYKSVRRGLDSPVLYPETIRLFTDQHLQQIGDRYLECLEMAAGAKAAMRITDKMPGNFSAIGLIHLALPKARIIHTIRDPIDTCLSCFSKLFSEEQPFTYDLAELGRYYRAYQRLMDHWHSVLPEGVLLDVRYEDLIADFEPQARRILAYCGLEWDDACLSFYNTDRPVRTASQVQVRQALYVSSVGRWRPAPEILRPLLEGLGIVPGAITGPSEVAGRGQHAGIGER
jgi:tetratricopeptide (TPR) repeat protein